MAGIVKEWMTGDPLTIAPEASALEAHERMLHRGIRHLPVIDARGELVGMLSIDDLRAALPVDLGLGGPLDPSQREIAAGYCVAEIMTHRPEVIRSESGLDEAAQRMADRRVGCLPVVTSDGQLEGILSETDVLHAIATSLWTDRVRERRGRANELALLIEDLRAERERIRREVVANADEDRVLEDASRGDGLDLPERAADVSGARLARTLHEMAFRRLTAIDHALARAERGPLNRCERCEGEIPIVRLRALPGTTLCVACARAGER